MKKNNPTTPILIREAAGTVPKIYARYEFGQEKSQSLEGKRNLPQPKRALPFHGHTLSSLSRLKKVCAYRTVRQTDRGRRVRTGEERVV